MIPSTALLLLSLSSFLAASSLFELESNEIVGTESVIGSRDDEGGAFELEKLVDMNEEELKAWLIAKRKQHDARSVSFSEFTGSDSDDVTPVSSPLPSSEKLQSPGNLKIGEIQDSQELLLSFSDAIRSNSFNEAVRLLKRIPDWKETKARSNFSVLSEISTYARNRCLGRLHLHRRDALNIFKPLLRGKHMELAGGYLAALALFREEIQMDVMSRLIGLAPTLRGYLLQASIYFKMDSSVISFILSSGASVSIQDEEHRSVSLAGIPPNYRPSSRDPSSPQMAVTRNFFMNFFEGVYFRSISDHSGKSSANPEINFLLGMLESVPKESGAFRAAFENYSSEIVMALVDLSPYVQMTKYHLAHLIAKNPEKQFEYPQIRDLVEAPIVFDRLMNGQPDLVALVFLSQLEPAEQLQKMSEFLANTQMFSPGFINHPQTTPRTSEPEFESTTGLYELPYNQADIFFLTACKWNIDDEAFARLYEKCSKINTKEFQSAKKALMKFCTMTGLDGKIRILSSQISRR